jgi:RNA polymerase sigma factor (sigma-70 family)
MAKHVSDSMLLERFVSRREEAAFVDLVKRHGPRVEGTCRRLLRNEQDVEDVFQATFLVLANKAARIPWRESVGGWLCAVAHRLAMNTRVDAARHRRRQTPFATLAAAGARAGGDQLPDQYHPLADPSGDIERNELRRVLDDELLRLPEKYRAPVVLCDLEGQTQQEAAAALGWPSGSISRRLARARALLRRRLIHRGVFLATGLVACGLAVLLVHRSFRPDDLGAMKVRPLMMSLRPVSEDEHEPGFANAVVGLARERSSTDRAQMITRARRAAQVATELERHDPGKNRDQWRDYAGETRRAAEQLVQNTQFNNTLAMLAAGHRLDASCMKCHEVFRQ